jgi:hypothetical protein
MSATRIQKVFTSNLPLITLFNSIKIFCGVDNIPQNIVSPTEHCYGYEECYAQSPSMVTILYRYSSFKQIYCWQLKDDFNAPRNVFA